MPQPEENEPTREQPGDPDKALMRWRRIAAQMFCQYLFSQVNKIRSRPRGDR